MFICDNAIAQRYAKHARIPVKDEVSDLDFLLVFYGSITINLKEISVQGLS